MVKRQYSKSSDDLGMSRHPDVLLRSYCEGVLRCVIIVAMLNPRGCARGADWLLRASLSIILDLSQGRCGDRTKPMTSSVNGGPSGDRRPRVSGDENRSG